MKKIAITLGLMISSFTFAQSITTPQITHNELGIGYSTNKSIDLKYAYIFDEVNGDNVRPYIGFGGTIGLPNGVNGSVFQQDANQLIVDQKEINNGSCYANAGIKIKKIKIGAKVGYGFNTLITDYYDTTKKYGNNGLYYKTNGAGSNVILAGIEAGLNLSKSVAISRSYDNYNKVSFGLNYNF
jgi:hypothetical protein